MIPMRLLLQCLLLLRRRRNPFRPEQPKLRSTLAWPSRSANRRRRRWFFRSWKLPRLTTLWLWTAVVGLAATGLGSGYAALEIRHEQEQRIMGRRTRMTENRLRQREIQWRLEQQKNQSLQAALAQSRALLAMERIRPGHDRKVWLADGR